MEGFLHELQGEVGGGVRADGEHDGAGDAADEAGGRGDGEAREERVAAAAAPPAARAAAARRRRRRRRYGRRLKVQESFLGPDPVLNFNEGWKCIGIWTLASWQ